MSRMEEERCPRYDKTIVCHTLFEVACLGDERRLMSLDSTKRRISMKGKRGLRCTLSVVAVLSVICAMLLLTVAATADEGMPATGPEGIDCQPVGGKFHDLDWDAQNWESGEPGLSGWTIKFKMEASPYTEYTTTTWNASKYGAAYLGKFEFPSMPGSTYSPKIYIVSEVLQTGWMQTYPSANGGVYRIKYYGNQDYKLLAPSGYPKVLNFGNAQLGTTGSIGDCVWHDDDRDGNGPAGCTKGPAFDPGESVIPGVGIWLLRQTTSNTYEFVDQDFTDANGLYLFTDLPQGNYVVDVLEAGVFDYFQGPYVLTTANEPYPYSLATGEHHRHADFGYDDPDTPGPVYVGDWVWYDIDKQGDQDDGNLLYTSPLAGNMYDTGIPCVSVWLYVGPTGATNVSQLKEIGLTNTDSWGNYAFPLMKPNAAGESYYTAVGSGITEDPDVTAFMLFYDGASTTLTCTEAAEYVDPAYVYGSTSAFTSQRMSPDGSTTPTLLGQSLPNAGDWTLSLDYGFEYTPTAVSLQSFGGTALPALPIEVAVAAAGALIAGAFAWRRRR